MERRKKGDYRPIQALVEAPDLPAHLNFYARAFQELSGSRAMGFGEGPIPLSEITAWCEFRRVGEDERDDVFFFVREMDDEYLTVKGEQADADRKKP